MIAIEFAKAVTRKTSNPKDLLARCGRCSLFSTLQEMFPQIVRSGTYPHGLTEVELNKLLQVGSSKIISWSLGTFADLIRLQADGFNRVRNRKACNRSLDPLGAGLYVFSGVRWLDPDDLDENQLLISGFRRLTINFPHLISMTLGGAERLSAILRRNRIEWIMQEQIACKPSQLRRAQCARVFNEPIIGPLAASIAGSPSYATVDHSPALRTRSPVTPPITVYSKGSVKSVGCDLLHCVDSPLNFYPPCRPLHDLPAHAGGVDAAAAGSAPEAGAWRWAWEDGELGPDATEGDSAGPALVLECSMGAERLLPDPI